MKTTIRLLPENVVQYARHRVMQINLSDLEMLSYKEWNNAFLNTTPINVIDPPTYFWKRGTISGLRLESPRLYVATADLSGISIPDDARILESARKLRGFLLRTNEGFRLPLGWQVEPVYF